MRLHFATLIVAAASSACLPTLDGLPDGGVQFVREDCPDGPPEHWLAQRTEHVAGTLRYRPVNGVTPESTQVTVDIDWPEAPVAVCYREPSTDGGFDTVRVVVEGLGARIETVDGMFDEELSARVYPVQAPFSSGASPSVVIVTTVQGLTGTWRPGSEQANAGSSVVIAIPLAPTLSQGSATVSLSRHRPEEIAAGVFTQRTTVASFP